MPHTESPLDKLRHIFHTYEAKYPSDRMTLLIVSHKLRRMMAPFVDCDGAAVDWEKLKAHGLSLSTISCFPFHKDWRESLSDPTFENVLWAHILRTFGSSPGLNRPVQLNQNTIHSWIFSMWKCWDNPIPCASADVFLSPSGVVLGSSPSSSRYHPTAHAEFMGASGLNIATLFQLIFQGRDDVVLREYGEEVLRRWGVYLSLNSELRGKLQGDLDVVEARYPYPTNGTYALPSSPNDRLA